MASLFAELAHRLSGASTLGEVPTQLRIESRRAPEATRSLSRFPRGL